MDVVKSPEFRIYWEELQQKYKIEEPDLPHEVMMKTAIKNWEGMNISKKRPFIKKYTIEQQECFENYKDFEIDNFKKDHPGMKTLEILKKLEYQWKGMTKQEKKPHKLRFQEDK